ncbi:DUF4402 domain-containing protein [Phenylobacterium sp.]|jgi:hypothetical protein|uniref:DUF4402 domain-containing protein n=1 Tax=Phenylobacterium sp. TaxID=1871053 RepID=UPI002F3E43F8
MNIRHTAIRVGAGLLLAALATSAFAAGTVSTTANATLTVMSPDTLTKTQDLVFGTVIRPSSGTNTIALSSTSGTVTVSAGAGNASVVNSTTSQARFNFVAPAATTYTTTQSLTFTQNGLTNVSAAAPTTTTGSLGTVPAGGTQDINVGGQFDISSATTAQNYTGTLTLTVNYN